MVNFNFKFLNHWLIHAPKKFHSDRHMISPGYALVLQWISEAWDEIDLNLIARSFDHCGIISSRLIDFNNQLRHFVRTTELVDELIQRNHPITMVLTRLKMKEMIGMLIIKPYLTGIAIMTIKKLKPKLLL